MRRESQLPRRERLVAWLLVCPIIGVAIGLLALEGWRQLRPRSPLFSEPFVYSLADAIEQGNVSAAFAFIRDGQDPNGAIVVQDEVLTGGVQARVSPLLWGIANVRRAGSLDVVRVLLSHGVVLDDARAREAICLARWLGDEPTATDLSRELRIEPSVSCGEAPADRPPVLALLPPITG